MYTANEKISTVNVADEMQKAYIDYSMSVIIGRALPDARDGLKPGNRRILFAMRELGLLNNRNFKKCATVVGEVLGKYHPHGDASVYDTLVRMAQPWAMRYPLINGHGNFGSVDGDPPAAYRYTESRLHKIAEVLLADLHKNTVDMQPNFDESTFEPKVLPAGFPNLLANGSTGIAVGMATNIPPHNLRELIDGICWLIDNESAREDSDPHVEDLMNFIKGPDFPTGGMVCGVQPIIDYFRTGRGIVKMRGKAGVEEVKGGKEQIVITEIPYNVNRATLVENIANLANEKRIVGITDIRDESDENTRIVIEMRRGEIPKVIINQLYKHTQLEATFGVIMLAIDHGRPKVMTLKALLNCYIEHRRIVIYRRTKFELDEAESRAHILEGFRIALDNLDDFVKIIRESRDRETAKVKLMEKYELSLRQADAILEMRLYQLTGLERDKIEKEYLELIKKIEELKSILASEQKVLFIVKKELLAVREEFGDERRCMIVPDEGEISLEDMVKDEGCVVTITHGGYIKRTNISGYRAQRRGGKGVIGMEAKEEDFVEHLFTASTHDFIMFFTGDGRVYVERVYDVPDLGRSAKGKAIANLLELREGEKIAAMIRVREFSDKFHLVMVTDKGIVKKTNLSAYSNPRKGGVIAIQIEEGDSLMGVKFTEGNNEIVLVTHDGMSIRFHEDQLRDQGRATVGVWGIRLEEGDKVVGIEIVNPNATLLVAGENGIGKRTDFEEYRKQSRGGKGIITMKTGEKTGKVIGALSVTDNDEIMLTTQQGQTVRCPVKDIRLCGRNTQGVKLIGLDEGDKLVAIARVVSEDQEVEEVENAKPEATQPDPTKPNQ
ncbi:MAG: DNA gyrase subunit A [Verrucomicrobiae bacterium]|nr:DNA gyrase subunit A [Verrucomicrobiae bacterium]